MAWLTPRRRLLITAPLAIILPAGILAYLGWRTIDILDSSFELITADLVKRQIGIIEELFEGRMGELEDQFLGAIEEAAERQRVDPPDPNAPPLESVFLSHPLPYLERIFYLSQTDTQEGETAPLDAPIHVYRRAWPKEAEALTLPDDMAAASIWIRNPDSPLADSAALKEGIQNPPSPIGFSNLRLAYYLIRSGSSSMTVGHHTYAVDTDPPGRFVVGAAFDEDWVADNILMEILNEEFVIDGISVVDENEDVVASTARNPEGLRKDGGLYPVFPRFSDEAFRWWVFHFPASPNEDFQVTYNEIKSVNGPLILAAVVIMLLAVIGAIRNMGSELSLAEMRSAFVARVSHELRTPLGLIRLFAETLEMGRCKDDGQGREYLQTITKESERLSRLIDNVLDFSQIEAGEKTYQLRKDSVEELVESVADLLRFHAERHGLEMFVRVEEGLPDIPFDRTAMEQAVWNLVSNAIKYSGAGKRIDLTARRDGPEITIEVRDEGIGIDAAQRQRVFQQFFRDDDPRVQEQGGSGLGLAVVEHIVKGHGGWVSLESQPGQGSTFGVHLPIDQVSHPPGNPGGRSGAA